MSRIAATAFKGLEALASSGPVKKASSWAARELPNLKSPAKAVGKVADWTGLNPSSPAAAAWLLPSAGFLAGVAQPMVKGMRAEKSPFDKELEEEMRRRRFQASQQMKAQRLQQAMADNMMRLASANPQLYNQLLVGRSLPQGAVVIGGGQRSDFLESVAYQMATGGFGNPQGTPDSPDVMQTLVDSY